MHLYIITRGIKNHVDQMITELQGKYFPFKYPDKEGNLQPCMVQMAVRPIQIWELAFPEDQKDVMLNTLLVGSKDGVQHKKHNKFVWAIRKMLGVEKIPEYKKDLMMPLYRADVEVNGVGIKQDYWVDAKTGKKIYNPTDEEKKICWEGL